MIEITGKSKGRADQVPSSYGQGISAIVAREPSLLFKTADREPENREAFRYWEGSGSRSKGEAGVGGRDAVIQDQEPSRAKARGRRLAARDLPGKDGDAVESAASGKSGVRRPSTGGGMSVPGLPDYTVYTLNPRQKIISAAVGSLILFGIGYLFYHNPFIALLLSAGGIFAPRIWWDYLKKRRRSALNLQFKQMLFSLSSSLSAGRSVENAFREAVQDLRMLDPEGGTDMIAELNIICTRLEYGQPVEEALQDLSGRAGMEDIRRFADVFSVCKRTGGDLVEVVRRTSSIIGEKLDVQQEIAVSVSQKRFESKALLVSPLIMLLFMSFSAGDYMLPMYTGFGMVISTFALAALILCYFWIGKIMDIPL